MTARHIGRRGFATLIGAGVAVAIAPRPSGAASREITVLNWKGYGTDEPALLKAFTAKTGITVKHDYFNSEPELLTKLQTNPGAYDVVLINSARTRQALAGGLIAPIDTARVPNSKSLSRALGASPSLVVDGKTYGIAWVWGINSLAVRRGTVANPDSLAVLLDPHYAGRMAMLDDTATAIGVGALLTGQDINDPRDLPAIRGKLMAMKPNLKLLWSSEDEWNKAFAANAFDVSIYWSGAAVRSIRKSNLPVDFVVPKEGAIGWLDGLSLPADSKKPDDALAFIDYMIDPATYLAWSNAAGAPASANEAAMAALPADNLNRQIHKPEYLASLQFMAPIPDERRAAFNDLWGEVKASYAK